MGLFSFGKKDDSGRDAYSDSPRGARHTVRTERRTRRSERTDADAMMLDPTLPEKQRARRRLVGAIALVLAAVIVLPMVLDSRPKPVTDDISINIPNRPAPAAKQSRDAADADSQAGVAHDNAPAAGATGASGSVAAGVTQPQAAAPAATAQAKTEAKEQAKPEAKAEAKPSKPAAVASNSAKPQAAAPAEEANTNAAANTATNAGAGAANTPSSPAGSRFVLQIGQFDEETAAQNWVNKLKAAGVPAYLEHRKQSDGSTKSLLRAGPFPDRASAQAALAKVKLAGLGGGARPTN